MSIEKKLSDLTTVPLESFEKIKDYLETIHSHDIVTQLLADKTLLELEIFEGKIYLQLEDDTVKYKFVPNERFSELVLNSILNKDSKLLSKVTEKLKKSLITWRKDLL